MKQSNFTGLVLCIVLAMPAVSMAGDSESSFRIGPTFGWNVPTGDLADLVDGSFSAGGRADYRFGKTFSAGGSVVYHNLSADVSKGSFLYQVYDALGGVQELDVSLSILEISMNGRLYVVPEGTVRVHAFAMVGAYAGFSSVTATIDATGTAFEVDESDSEWDLAGGGGAGFEINLGSMTVLDVSGGYHIVADKEDDVGPTMFVVAAATLFFEL